MTEIERDSMIIAYKTRNELMDHQLKNSLTVDIKTLNDIAKMMESDSAYKSLPGILRGIADDIEKTVVRIR